MGDAPGGTDRPSSRCVEYLSGLSVPDAAVREMGDKDRRAGMQLYLVCIRNTRGQLPGSNEIPASLVDIPEASPHRG